MVFRFAILLAVLLSLTVCERTRMGTVVSSGSNGYTVSIGPEDSLHDRVGASPKGTTFKLRRGVYRVQNLRPKDNQKFIGVDGVVFSGAMVIRDWRRQQDQQEIWIHEGLPKPLHRSGYCRDETPLCTYREDLFVNGVYYPRVASLSELRAGRWFFENGKAYLNENPGGKTVELSLAPVAIAGNASGVVLKNIVVEKYASEAQHGAIDVRRGQDWELIDVVARWNHGGGLAIGHGLKVKGGAFSRNGQIGIVGTGNQVTIESAEIAYNNYAEFSAGWEAGGTKFVRTTDLVVRGSCVHHNSGPGLWTDIDNANTLYESNMVFDNDGDGIKHEISYSATIRNNVSGNNGQAFDSWLWGSQILIQNSSNVEVFDNTVQVAASGGNAISMIYQDRGDGALGPWDTTKNRVYQNKIIFLGANGAGGMVADFEIEKFSENRTNRFEKNIYYFEKENFPHWRYSGRPHRWLTLRASGAEVGSEKKLGIPKPIDLSCKK